jgi:hypothetical protein
VRALSRHTNAQARIFEVSGRELNQWCRIPGSPFADGLLLLPNPPDRGWPVVSFGPIQAPGIDAITCLLVSPPRPEHANRLAVRLGVQTAVGELLAQSDVVLGNGDRAPVTLRFGSHSGDGVRLTIEVGFEHFAGGPAYGSVRMRYLAAYADNELTRLFNSAGSDKGSEVYWGEGVPHMYGLTYEPLLAPLRERQFNLLEIGLDTASQVTGEPADAPSLRAWREFFPHATLFGYDINDFGFFKQRDTRTFQGDQASPEHLRRFIEASGFPHFTVIVDDGSHVPSHQQTALAHLFEHLEGSGFYFIEDLSWQPYDESPTTADVLRGFVRDRRIDSPFIPRESAGRLESTIADVSIYRPNDSELAVITKATE